MGKRGFLLIGISEKGKEKQSLVEVVDSAVMEEVAFALSMAAIEMIKATQAKFFSVNNWEDQKLTAQPYDRDQILSLEHLFFSYLSKMMFDQNIL